MSLRILLADDEKEFVDTLAERLSLRGFAPYVVYDGISALQAATPEKPDVVVLDLFMPGLSGDEVLRRLKVLYPDLPVILLTGHEAVDDNGTNPVERNGLYDTIPLSFNVFLETLQAAVREGKECSATGGKS